MLDLLGQQLGNYRLTRVLGQGGYAAVYLGEHIHLNSLAAIKVLHTRLASSEEVNNFQNEGRIVAGLIHPHIVRVFDFDVEKDIPFMVMDYAPNGNLRWRFPKGERAELATILPYIKQVAGALQYAHDQQFIHRDIKPENMLLGRDDEVLLSDFGTALVAQSTGYQSSLQEVVGTVSYMAPEQFQGKARPASDQYALAVVIYEWLSGELPFHGSGTEIAIQHSMKPPPPLREKILHISPLVEQVIMKALSKDHHERFPRVQDFADAMEHASRVDESIYSDPTVAVVPAIPNPSHQGEETIFNPQSVPIVPPVAFPVMKPSPLAMDTVTSEVPHAVTPVTPVTPPTVTEWAPPPQYAPISVPYSHQEKVIPRKRRALPIVLLLLSLIAILLAGSIACFVLLHSSGKVSLFPSGQVYPDVAGTYHGKLTNTTANITTSMALSIQQNKAAINGNFTVGAPLVGSNPFQGTVDTANHIQFTVQSYRGNAPLFFDGTLQSDGSLSGSYCSLGPNKQCSANAGASGTWSVSKG
ncbi:MAG TPA: serine/threonine-protein kinase [Ktedonobacteraceae bacterium]|nr:serine/threonine-protein kinase [Ktedonobacteraceae bacterium]